MEGRHRAQNAIFAASGCVDQEGFEIPGEKDKIVKVEPISFTVYAQQLIFAMGGNP